MCAVLTVLCSFTLIFVNGDLLHLAALVLAQEQVGCLHEPVRRVTDIEMGLPGGVVGLEPPLAQDALQMVGAVLAGSTSTTFRPMNSPIIVLIRG